MRKTWLGVLVVVSFLGCGGGSNRPPSGDDDDDAQPVDARVDAEPDADAHPPVNIPDAMIDAAPVPTGVCNPLAQTGCNAGEKCTWIQDRMIRRSVTSGAPQQDRSCSVAHAPTRPLASAIAA